RQDLKENRDEKRSGPPPSAEGQDHLLYRHCYSCYRRRNGAESFGAVPVSGDEPSFNSGDSPKSAEWDAARSSSQRNPQSFINSMASTPKLTSELALGSRWVL